MLFFFIENKNLDIRYFHVPHNILCLPPKILYKIFVSHFSWVLQSSQEKLKAMLMPKYEGGGGGANKLCYGGCGNGEYQSVPRAPWAK